MFGVKWGIPESRVVVIIPTLLGVHLLKDRKAIEAVESEMS